MTNNRNNEPLLRVEHLCQYFGSNKAVDDVSFDIKKGEVFGLVGESGCGKTTTGRSIIKLYDITGGSVYFKGIRIAAGTAGYKSAIAQAKKDLKEKTEAAKTDEERRQIKEECERIIAENREKIKSAEFDKKNCDKEYSDELKKQADEKYKPLIANATGEKLAELTAEYKNELRKAKNAKLVTQIQMIFQDPIA